MCQNHILSYTDIYRGKDRDYYCNFQINRGYYFSRHKGKGVPPINFYNLFKVRYPSNQRAISGKAACFSLKTSMYNQDDIKFNEKTTNSCAIWKIIFKKLGLYIRISYLCNWNEKVSTILYAARIFHSNNQNVVLKQLNTRSIQTLYQLYTKSMVALGLL